MIKNKKIIEIKGICNIKIKGGDLAVCIMYIYN
jgi:hypothetical protein